MKVKVTCLTHWPIDPSTRRPVDILEKEPLNSNSEVHLHMPLRCSSKRQRIRLCSWGTKAKGAFCSCVAWGWRLYNIVESESDPLTRRTVDLFEKEPLKGKWEVRQRTSGEIGNKHTNKHTHTNKRCSNYSMITIVLTAAQVCLILLTIVWTYWSLLSTDIRKSSMNSSLDARVVMWVFWRKCYHYCHDSNRWCDCLW